MVAQVVAVGFVLALDPQRFDACDPVAPQGPRSLQAAIAVGTTFASAALALWQLRRWYLVGAALALVIAGSGWFLLLSPTPNC